MPGVRIAVGLGGLLAVAAPGAGQDLETRLDEAAYLRGLVELHLPEVLEAYIAARPDADATRAEAFALARARMALTDPDADGAARIAAVGRLLAVREGFIEASSDRRRVAAGRAEQAADLYFEMLPIDGTELTVLFGVATPAQRERFDRTVRRMQREMTSADRALDEAIRGLENDPAYARDITLRLERSRLVREERERRLPFFHGVGLVLDGVAGTGLDDATRRDRLEAGRRRLEPLADVLEGDLGARARLYTGLALVGLDEHDAAETRFRAVAEADDVDPALAFAARMGGVWSRERERGAEAALRGLESIAPRYEALGIEGLFYRLLLADRRFLLRRAVAEAASPAERTARLAEAFAAYLDPLETETPETAPIMRAWVEDRLRLVSAGDLPLADLPAAVSIARAARLADEESTRVAGLALYDDVLARDDLDSRTRAAAWFGRGRTQLRLGAREAAGTTFLALAEALPEAPEAGRAIEAAALLAAEAHRADPDDPATRARLHAVLDRLQETFTHLPSIDRWRYEAARLALGEERYEAALSALRTIAPDAAIWAEANVLRGRIERDRMNATEPGAERTTRAERLLETSRRGQLVIGAEERLATTPGRRADLAVAATWLRVFEAEALLELGRADEAADRLAGVERAGDLEPGVLGAAIRVRMNALRAGGRAAEGFEGVRDFARTAPAEAAPIVGHLLAALQADVEAMLAEGREAEASAYAAAQLLPFAQILERALTFGGDADGRAVATRWGRVADAYRLGGRHDEALPIYNRLLIDDPDALTLLLGRAECLHAAGGDALGDAMRVYRRIAAVGPDVAGEAWWLAELRMLQILDAANRNTQKISPRIERLRLRDPEFGGERYRRGFEALLSRHGVGAGG